MMKLVCISVTSFSKKLTNLDDGGSEIKAEQNDVTMRYLYQNN